MLLSVHSRLILLGMVAKTEGDLTTLRLVRDFQAALGFDEAELAALKFVTVEGVGRGGPEGSITWTQGVAPKEVEVGPVLKKVLTGMFDAQAKAEKLTLELLPLYEQFLAD